MSADGHTRIPCRVLHRTRVLGEITQNGLTLRERVPCNICTMVHHQCNNSKAKDIPIQTEPFSDQYSVEKEIGRGKFAVVKRCKHNTTGQTYAAKFLRKRRKGKDCREDVMREVEMLKESLVSPRLVNLLEVYETSHEIILIMEYAAGGELHKHFVQEDRFQETDVIRLMRQVLEGLHFLHHRNIVHLDVKPSNILLTGELPETDVKLCDFGFARRLNAEQEFRDIIGTIDYVAPEILSYEPINTASDMWSVGVLTYVMLTGASPFAGDDNQETFLNISQVNLEFPDDLFSDVSQDAQDFISKLLTAKPQDRLTAQECLHHRWLRTDDDLPTTPQKLPFGSPVGQRRALTPPSPDSNSEVGPLKKSKCDEGASLNSDSVPTQIDSNLCSSPVPTKVASLEVPVGPSVNHMNLLSPREYAITEVAEFNLFPRAVSLPNSPLVSKKDFLVSSVPASPVVSKRVKDVVSFDKISMNDRPMEKLDELQENLSPPVCV